MRPLLLALIFALASGATSAAESWFLFKDPNSAFTVEVLGTPTITRHTTKAADGSEIPGISYQTESGTTAMYVADDDFTKVTVDPGKAIDGAIGALKNMAVTILLDQLSELDGRVGHEILYLDKDGNQIDDRVYFVKGHLYQDLGVTPKGATNDEKAKVQHFLASFHFK